MILKCNAKIGVYNILQGKEKFTVGDMINLLSSLDEKAEIRFGVKVQQCVGFYQNDNLIFRLAQDSREDEWKGHYNVEIITQYI